MPGGLATGERTAAELRAARSELEEIAGRRRLAVEPPPLPGPLALALSAADQAWIHQLRAKTPEEWTGAERRRLEALVDRCGGDLAGLSARGEQIDADTLLRRAPDLLQGAVVATLQGRLALLHGDEGTALSGIEVRSSLAKRLYFQPGFLGPLLANAIQRLVLDDVQQLAERSATAPGTLRRLEDLLIGWQTDLPDAAAVVAREGLEILSRMDGSRQASALTGSDSAGRRPELRVARAFLGLAQVCREKSCRRATVTLAERRNDDEPRHVVADLVGPNLLAGAEKLDDTQEIARTARIAVGLRIEAPDLGGYPADASRLSPPLQAALGDLDDLSYELHGAAGARLVLDLGAASETVPGPARDEILRLLTWDLPALPAAAVAR